MRRLLFALVAFALLPLAATAEGPAGKKEARKADAGKPVIAVFRLAGSITESPADETFSFSLAPSTPLKDLVARMKKAAADPEVKAVVLLPDGASLGLAQTEEVRQAMKQIRAAGKDIFAHADSLTMREYVLLSGASRLSVVPTADLWVTGISGEAPYVRGLLDLLGVKPDFLTCGAYKSAAEIFMRTGPSPEAE